MNFYFLSIFPDIYKCWAQISLIEKAQKKGLVKFHFINIRDFCQDKHKQIDDEIYGGGKGMLIKAKPVINAVEWVISHYNLNKFKIIYLAPSKNILNQKKLQSKYLKYNSYILISGRYEGIDFRFEQYLKDKYKTKFERLSIGKYVLMGGELASMVFAESLIRLLPGAVKELDSIKYESYSPEHNMKNIEYPQYTRPAEVYGYKVPNILLSGNHKEIEKRRQNNQIF